MKSSIMPISDSDSTCHTPNQQREYLFKNYTNIPNMNQEQLFSGHCAQDKGYQHYKEQVRFLCQQIRALHQFHKTINEEIQFLICNFSYIMGLAAKNIDTKMLSFNLGESKSLALTTKFQESKVLTQKIQLLQADLKNERELNKSLKEEILQCKHALRAQSQEIKKMSSHQFSNDGKTITDEDIIRIEKKNWGQQQGNGKFKEGWTKGEDQEEVDRLEKMRERCKKLKKQLEHSRQQLIEYN